MGSAFPVGFLVPNPPPRILSEYPHFHPVFGPDPEGDPSASAVLAEISVVALHDPNLHLRSRLALAARSSHLTSIGIRRYHRAHSLAVPE